MDAYWTFSLPKECFVQNYAEGVIQSLCMLLNFFFSQIYVGCLDTVPRHTLLLVSISLLLSLPTLVCVCVCVCVVCVMILQYIYIYILFPFQDCMYLHELGEEAASFTKEEMQQGYVALSLSLSLSLCVCVCVCGHPKHILPTRQKQLHATWFIFLQIVSMVLMFNLLTLVILSKHQEYELKLYEQYMNSQNLTTTSVTPPVPTKPQSR